MATASRMVALQAVLVGEQAEFGGLRVEDVPLSNGVNLDVLKQGDDAPLEVVVALPSGKSKRGWNYTPAAIKSIVSQVAQSTAPGYLGHPDPKTIDHKFDPPVTHWIGAKFDDAKGIGYFRGLVDKAAVDLKRWIKGGRINTTSIFGEPVFGPKLAGAGEQVIDYRLISNDWTPLGRNGMPTQIVAFGEMDDSDHPHEKEPRMLLGEIAADFRKDRVTAAQLFGEMNGAAGWGQKEVLDALGVRTLEDVAVTVDPEGFKALKAHSAAFGEMATALGLDPKTATAETLGEKLKGVIEHQATAAKTAHTATVTKVVGEMVKGQGARADAARTFVAENLKVDLGADEAAIKKAVGEMAESPTIKALLGDVFVTPSVAGEQAGGSSRAETDAKNPVGLRPSARRL